MSAHTLSDVLGLTWLVCFLFVWGQTDLLDDVIRFEMVGFRLWATLPRRREPHDGAVLANGAKCVCRS